MTWDGSVDRRNLAHPEVLEVTVDGAVGVLEMNEPDRMNPLGVNEMHIHYALLEMHANPDVRVVIITGRGRAFCAGADIRPTQHSGGHDDRDWPRSQRLAYKYAFGNMWETLHNFPKPLIAAVNGYALGGGWEVAQMCDWILASRTAVFGAVEIDVGLPPFANACNYLTKMLGKHRAMDLIVNARKLTADEALALGLVNRVTSPESLMDDAGTLALEIASRPPVTVAAIKQLVDEAAGHMEHYRLERALAYFCMTLDDYEKARTAAAQREARPGFTGS